MRIWSALSQTLISRENRGTPAAVTLLMALLSGLAAHSQAPPLLSIHMDAISQHNTHPFLSGPVFAGPCATYCIPTVSWAFDGGSLRLGASIWNVEGTMPVRTFGGSEIVAYSPNGNEALTAVNPDGEFGAPPSSFLVSLVDLTSGRDIRRLDYNGAQAKDKPGLLQVGGVHKASFSPDGRRALLVWNGIQLWDLSTGVRLATPDWSKAGHAQFSSDGLSILVQQVGGVTVYEYPALKERCFIESPNPIGTVEFSADGQHILIVADSVQLRDAHTCKEQRSFVASTNTFSRSRLTPDNQLLVANVTKPASVNLWNAQTGQLIEVFAPAEANFATDVLVSNDGKRLLVRWELRRKGTGDFDEVSLWDIASQRELHRFEEGKRLAGPNPPFHPLYVVGFSPDSKTIAVTREGSEPDSIWSAETGQLVRSFPSLTSQVRTTHPAAPEPQTSPAQVLGRVVRSDTGAPISGATVELNTGEMDGACCHTTLTDSNGEYSFRDLKDEIYIASSFADGFVTSDYHCSPGPGGVCKDREQHVTVSSHLVIDFRLLPEATISGVVLTPDGGSVGSGLIVQAVPTKLLHKSSRGVYPNWGEAKTNDTGGFTLRGLPPGTYLLRVHQTLGGRVAQVDRVHLYHEAWYGGTPTPKGALPVQLKEAQHRDNLRLTVHAERRYNITLWMSGPDGSPPPREYIITMPDSDTTASRQPDGSYLIRNVSPGHYTLGVFAVGLPIKLASPHDVDIDVKEDDVNLHINITGK